MNYQSFEWYKEGVTNNYGVTLNDPEGLRSALAGLQEPLYLYTQHEIFLGNELEQTRSSPNWLGGMVTYATCKHNMRTYNRGDWQGRWIAGLCPKKVTENCVLFVGKVMQQFTSNYLLSGTLKNTYPDVYSAKRASSDPRGDLYTPRRRLDTLEEWYDHNNFIEPPGHTRSTEYYKKSPGSVSERADGLIPKWWRDIEYQSAAGVRPPVFILDPCWLFSKPLVYTAYVPGRASLRLTCNQLAASLSKGG